MTAGPVEVLLAVRDTLRAGRAVALCVIAKARGSTPQHEGSLMAVDEAAHLHGTVGGGCVEAEVRRQAHAMLTSGRGGLLRYKLDADYGWDDGLICGGTVEIAVVPRPNETAINRALEDLEARRPASIDLDVDDRDEPFRLVLNLLPRERLYIAGAGHVGQALARLALDLEFDVTLFDDRADLLERMAPPGCASVAGDIADRLSAAPVDATTYAVVVTRGHRHDAQALAALVGRGACYVGMIGSRRKVKVTVDELVDRGVPAEALAAVHAPIGLDIGSVTVPEIALSIAAQLVQVRRALHGAPVRVERLSHGAAP